MIVFLHSRIVNKNDNIMRDAFKCGLKVILRHFDGYHYCLMNLECRFCNFESEIIHCDRMAFISRCHRGKLSLPSLTKIVCFNALFSSDLP